MKEGKHICHYQQTSLLSPDITSKRPSYECYWVTQRWFVFCKGKVLSTLDENPQKVKILSSVFSEEWFHFLNMRMTGQYKARARGAGLWQQGSLQKKGPRSASFLCLSPSLAPLPLQRCEKESSKEPEAARGAKQQNSSVPSLPAL